MPFEKGKQGYTHETPWVSGKGRKITKVLPPALIKAFNGLTNEGKAFGLRCERLTFLNDDALYYVDALLDALDSVIVRRGTPPDSEEKKKKIIEALHSIFEGN
jgi:hypothetical protein